MKNKSEMTITRTRLEGFISQWKVNFSDKKLERIAKRKYNKNKLTLNQVEVFEVGMRAQDGSTGYLRHLNSDMIVEYTTEVKDMGDTVKIRFKAADYVFDYVFSKTFRSYMTGAFYRFFRDMLTKSPVFATVKYN